MGKSFVIIVACALLTACDKGYDIISLQETTYTDSLELEQELEIAEVQALELRYQELAQQELELKAQLASEAKLLEIINNLTGLKHRPDAITEIKKQYKIIEELTIQLKDVEKQKKELKLSKN